MKYLLKIVLISMTISAFAEDIPYCVKSDKNAVNLIISETSKTVQFMPLIITNKSKSQF